MLALAPGAAAQTGNAEAFRQTGLQYYRAGQIASAIEAYQSAIELDPLNPQLYLEKADIFLSAGRPEDAEATLSEASMRFPDSRAAGPAYNLLYHDLAEMWASGGRLGKARDAMQAASRFEGRVSPAVIYKRIGDFSSDLLRLDDALVAYRRALEIAPDDLGARLALANLHLRRNSLDEALDEFAAILRVAPESVDAHHGVAEAHRRRGDFAEAAEAAARTLELSPGQPGAWYIRGVALMRLGRDQEAQDALERYRQIQSDAAGEEHRQREINAYLRGSADLELRGEVGQAIALYQEGIRSYPDASALYLGLGTAQSEAGLHRDAIATFLEWLERGGADTAMAHRSLAREYALIGDLEASERHDALAAGGLSVDTNP
jgi:tetratricopeptide (TPR) repeat protein